MTRGPSDSGHQGADALYGDMDATTAPHRIPPEMPQYGEANHVFELMQVTRAALPCRDTRRWPGNLLLRSGCAPATPHQGGVTFVTQEDAQIGLFDSCAIVSQGTARPKDAP